MQEKGHILSNQTKPSVCSGKSDMKISVAHPGFARKSWEFGKSLEMELRYMMRRLVMQRVYRDSITKFI